MCLTGCPVFRILYVRIVRSSYTVIIIIRLMTGYRVTLLREKCARLPAAIAGIMVPTFVFLNYWLLSLFWPCFFVRIASLVTELSDDGLDWK